ncbi:hypothetical protein B0H19DRAFT_1065467 [Mycena capillaripes]|nr:hypothetical protein B0H19DRAFT_1065467 [Mycena capillaripes]
MLYIGCDSGNDKGDSRVGLYTDKGDPQVGVYTEKNTTYQAQQDPVGHAMWGTCHTAASPLQCVGWAWGALLRAAHSASQPMLARLRVVTWVQLCRKHIVLLFRRVLMASAADSRLAQTKPGYTIEITSILKLYLISAVTFYLVASYQIIVIRQSGVWSTMEHYGMLHSASIDVWGWISIQGLNARSITLVDVSAKLSMMDDGCNV